MLASCFAANPYLAMTSSRRQPDRVETDVYRAALLFMATIPTLEQRPGAIRFWYNNGGTPGSLNSIQSTYLWEYSKLQRGDKGMPYLGPPELELLHAPGVKWLGLLGTAEDQLAQGRTALIEQGIPHRTLEHHVLTSGSVTLYVELLDLQKGG
jgi:hypothetical protein